MTGRSTFMKKLSSWNVVYAVLLFFVFFFAGNGILGLTHPDEVFYTQTAQEMIQHKTWIVPYLFDGPNFEKPIFSYWLFILGFKMFGVSSFSARFFPAVFAVLGVLGVYFLGKTAFRDEKKGLYAALVLMSSLLYVGLARTVFTDMFFTVLIELSLVFFYWAACPLRKAGASCYSGPLPAWRS
jgi:4-amino-4-deoxy-L-arabinose transferase-like glycosyltransferase